MRRRAAVLLVSFVLLMLAVSTAGLAEPVYPGRPSPPRLMNDLARMLTPAERDQIEAKLLALESATGVQFAVVVVRDLGGVSVEEYAVRLFEEWGIGERASDNGLLLLISEQDRAVRFEVGYGLEGDLPDGLVGRIMDETLLPNFRRGDYARGILEAISAVERRLTGETSPLPAQPSATSGLSPDEAAAIVFVVIVVVIMVLNGVFRGRFPGGPGGTRPNTRPYFPFGPGPRSGGWTPRPPGSGGRGFGGFGGGRSGGGGASRKW
ncbi:MAG: TPM domain-containing protein [Firmicutes bacterium]|nr:TPM domain-containing protein [Bacillota bacterium]